MSVLVEDVFETPEVIVLPDEAEVAVLPDEAAVVLADAEPRLAVAK